MKTTHLLTLLILVFTSCEKENVEVTEDDPITISDIDGNIYHTVRIGNQLWLLENLKTTRFQNGDLINELDESNSKISSFTSYNYDQNLSNTYGYLYNRSAAQDERKICPKGWHIPSDSEWNTLLNYVENNSGKLKIKGSNHWISENSDATNESGFTALPGGQFNFTFKRFENMGYEGSWWSSGSVGGLPYKARFNIRNRGSSIASLASFHEGDLFSIRCIRD